MIKEALGGHGLSFSVFVQQLAQWELHPLQIPGCYDNTNSNKFVAARRTLTLLFCVQALHYSLIRWHTMSSCKNHTLFSVQDRRAQGMRQLFNISFYPHCSVCNPIPHLLHTIENLKWIRNSVFYKLVCGAHQCALNNFILHVYMKSKIIIMPILQMHKRGGKIKWPAWGPLESL